MTENTRKGPRAKADVGYSVAKQRDERLAPSDLASTFGVRDGAALRPNSSLRYPLKQSYSLPAGTRNW